MRKYFNSFLITLVLIAIGLSIQNFQAEDRTGFAAYFFDVGQGDATYFRGDDGFEVLIDGGPDDSIVTKLQEVMAPNDRELDVVMLTHPHSDHLTGLREVLKIYSVDAVYMTDATHTSDGYFEWLQLIKEKKVQTITPRSGENFDWGESMVFETLYPDHSFLEQNITDLNRTSIVGIVHHNESSFMMTGDADRGVTNSILAQSKNISADVLKVPHHGSKDNTNSDFLEAIKPTYAVIFAGKNNKFGHPHAQALDDLANINAKIYTTFKDGDIVFRENSDGMLTVNLEK